MPELPEVETVARQLAPHLRGRALTGVRVLWERTLGGSTRQAFGRAVRGLRIERVGRRGKHVVLETSRRGRDAGALVVHLRMTGRLVHGAPPGARGPHTRIVLALDDGTALRFDDPRKFGRMTYAPDPAAFFAHLGVEPLSDAFTGAWLVEALHARRRALKPLLLDQSVIAGLGNIYVDEALHRASLHPERTSRSVPRAKALRLHRAIRSLLRRAIEREGTSFDAAYRTPEGEPGTYQDHLRVYGREGRPCRACGRSIRRIVVGQRGTHVCTRCQPAPRRRRARTGARTTIRRARVDDAASVAAIHVRAWQHAYRGYVPQDHLDGLDAEAWTVDRRRWIREPRTPQHRVWVLERAGTVLGFAATGPSRDADGAEATGEVEAIYLDPELVGTGLGRRLFAYSLMALRRLGFREAVVWVLEGNERARRFYASAGCTLDPAVRTIRLGGADLQEVRYRRPLA